jgi:SAM-dependent methyltransferase
MFKAKKYDNLYNNRDSEVNFLLKYLKGKTVLDIGGGTGIISEALNKKGFHCLNIEPQKEMADISEKRNIKTICCSAEGMNKFVKGNYDNVIMVFDVFNFLDNPNKVLDNISIVLKGKLIFRYWNDNIKENGWKFNWNLKRLSYKKWIHNKIEIRFWFPFWYEKHIMTVYSDKSIDNMLKNTGFKITDKIKNKYTTTIVAEI